jgi:hypothetical protein
VVQAGQQSNQIRPSPSYLSVLLSKLTYHDTKHSDTNSYLNFPVYGNPYTSGYNHVGYRPIVYGNSPFSSNFRPYNSAYLDSTGRRWNIPIQFYASQFHPHLTPQNLEHFTQFHTSQLYPHFIPNDLMRQFNHFYNFIERTYNNLNNIRNGPVTVLVQSTEDPTKLVATFVENGLQTLGKCSSLYIKE